MTWQLDSRFLSTPGSGCIFRFSKGDYVIISPCIFFVNSLSINEIMICSSPACSQKKTRVKRGGTKGDKNQIEKRRKGNKTLSQKSEKGREKS
jgi:hypothetical protein